MDNAIVDKLIYAGTHLRNKEAEELIKEVRKISNPAILKLLTIAPIDYRIKEEACKRINDAEFLKRLGSNRLGIDHFTTAYCSWSHERLAELPNSFKFITEE